MASVQTSRDGSEWQLANIPAAIASYRRADTCREKTVAFLRRHGWSASEIFVFCDPDEFPDYLSALRELATVVRVEQPGLVYKHREICRFFTEGEPVLHMDDDVSEVYQRAGEQARYPLRSLRELVANGFRACSDLQAGAWGVYPVLNPYFMKDRLATGLNFLIGCLWGGINTHDPEMQVTLEHGEDYERSIKFYLRDGNVLRFDNLATDNQAWTEPGGWQARNRNEQEQLNCFYELTARYPGLCEVVYRGKSRTLGMKLADKRPIHAS